MKEIYFMGFAEGFVTAVGVMLLAGFILLGGGKLLMSVLNTIIIKIENLPYFQKKREMKAKQAKEAYWATEPPKIEQGDPRYEMAKAIYMAGKNLQVKEFYYAVKAFKTKFQLKKYLWVEVSNDFELICPSEQSIEKLYKALVENKQFSDEQLEEIQQRVTLQNQMFVAYCNNDVKALEEAINAGANPDYEYYHDCSFGILNFHGWTNSDVDRYLVTVDGTSRKRYLERLAVEKEKNVA